MKMRLSEPGNLAMFCLALAFAVTAAVYWPGLAGPLLFDDYWNLAPISRWHAGGQDFLPTLLPNAESIVYSRPVAIGSIMLTTWLSSSDTTFQLKLGNLIVHLACGASAWWVLRHLARRDEALSVHSKWLPAVLITFWLLHPLHVSTVLYAIQRMAQLSALFTLLAMGIYMVARLQLARGERFRATIGLYVLVPLATVLGVLSKQNAVVIPALCLLVELTYFSAARGNRRFLAPFYVVGLVIPLLAATAILVLEPQRIMIGYADLEFTAWQRLLGQPRALLDYVGMWLIPRGSRMGLYTDDFPASMGLFTPVTTLPALAGVAAISLLAFRLRRRAPSVFFGWFFFLIAHSVESSFLPLEMYYEHRNYLPSIGIMFALAGMISMATGNQPRRVLLNNKMLAALAALLLVVITSSTFARVLVWQDEDAMTLQGMRHHPDSIRVHLDRLSLALRRQDHAAAHAALLPMVHSDEPRQRLVGLMDSVSLDCITGNDVDPNRLRRATDDAQPKLTVHEVHVALLQEAITRNGACTKIPADQFADSLVRLLDAAVDQPESAPNKSTIRRLAGQLYARSGAWDKAEKQAAIGWQGLQTPPLGVLLSRAYAKNGKHVEAEKILNVLQKRVRPFDTLWQGELDALREFLMRSKVSEVRVQSQKHIKPDLPEQLP